MATEAAPASLSALVRAQQNDLSVLRVFVDALRAIKRPERVDAEVRHAIRACSDTNEQNTNNANTNKQDINNQADADLMRFTHSIQALFARLSDTMKQLGDAPPPPPPNSGRPPPAPAGLLSLRDYAVLQATLEVFYCWSIFPAVEDGLVLSLDRRRPTKTLEISTHVLAWGINASRAATRILDVEATGRHVFAATQSMLQVLRVPQLQPILLPKYAVEIVALLVYSEQVDNTATQQQSQDTLTSLLRVLPLRLSMSSLRVALSQSTGRSPSVVAFKKRCGQLLTQLMMEDGGVQNTIEMLLSGVDEGNTQARMQVATLICQCPAQVEPAVYASSLTRQVRTLLDGSNRQNKLLRETAAVLVSEMATRFPVVFDSDFVIPMLQPLLIYETPNGNQNPVTATETDIAECVALLHLLLCGPPPGKALVLALVPVFRPLVHLYGFAVASKSLLGPPLEETLVAFVRAVPVAATLLQISVLPVVPPLRPTLAPCGPSRAQSPTVGTVEWTPVYAFCPGGSGGVAMRIRPQQLLKEDAEEDASAPLRLALAGMIQLLACKELETSTVVGELFSSLLLTYMRVRKSLTAEPTVDEALPTAKETQEPSTLAAYEPLKAPRDALGLELTLSLLLAIIELLGPSVLRSAETVLQCLTTVLGMFAREKTPLVDTHEDVSIGGNEEEDDDDEVLTVCLGVLLTILEAGASTRSDSEERELRAMLPVLEELSHYPRPQISELATNARASILSRGASDSPAPKLKVENESFEQTLRTAAEDLQSKLVPLRARGVVTLTKLVRRSEAHRHDAQWTPRITQLMMIFIDHLADAESYVYLAAVQGLAALSDAHPDVAIPLLTANLRDTSHSLEARIKLSEALLLTAKRCGETLPKYAKVLVYTYLECVRPPPRAKTLQAPKPKKPFSLIQEINPDEIKPEPTDEEREAQVQAANATLAQATLRASCLSNLAEVSAMLQWSLAPFAGDVLSCVFGVLQLELDLSATSVVAVRRGAVFLLKYVLQLMGYKILEVLPAELKPMYHTLKHVERVDRDDVVRFHAQRALQTLDEIMRAELFPPSSTDETIGGLHALRIVKH